MAGGKVLTASTPETKEGEEVVEISERQIETIEPGAAIEQGYLIPVPAEYDAFKLELKVVVFTKTRWRRQKNYKNPEGEPATAFHASATVVSDDAKTLSYLNTRE